MESSIVFVGSTHSFLDDFSKQKEIIERLNPEFVLSEGLENLVLDSDKKFEDILDKKFISNMTKFEEVENLIKLCFEKKIKLIGIDFHNFGFDEDLQKKIKSQSELTKEDEEKLDNLIEKRVNNHLLRIMEYREKTQRPMIVTLGSWHLRKEAPLRKKLKNYKIIAPISENGEIMVAPEENKEIKYGEISSDE